MTIAAVTTTSFTDAAAIVTKQNNRNLRGTDFFDENIEKYLYEQLFCGRSAQPISHDVKLTSDIHCSNGANGLVVQSLNNGIQDVITVDCDGHTISGIHTAGNYGIAGGTPGNTDNDIIKIKNCVIDGFDTGVGGQSGYMGNGHFVFENIVTKNNLNIGMELYASSDYDTFKVKNVIVTGNLVQGILIDDHSPLTGRSASFIMDNIFACGNGNRQSTSNADISFGSAVTNVELKNDITCTACTSQNNNPFPTYENYQTCESYML